MRSRADSKLSRSGSISAESEALNALASKASVCDTSPLNADQRRYSSTSSSVR